MLGIMSIYYLRSRDPIGKKAIERMIDRLAELAVDRGHYAYFPNGYFMPTSRIAPDTEMPTGLMAEEIGGRAIQGLALAYKATGYESARDLGQKLVNYLRHRRQYYDEDGRFLWDPEARKRFQKGAGNRERGGHFHAHTLGLLSMLDFALATDDRELISYVKGAYEWAKSPETHCSALVGFFPEWIDSEYQTCESCEIADMIAIALKLTVAGTGDYLDDVDRWVRNHFVESQLKETDWIYEAARDLPETPAAFNESIDRVPERSVGAFAGWSPRK